MTRSCISLALGLMLLTPFAALAEGSAELSITPVLIDEKAKPRDILKEEIVIVNTSNRKLNLYPSVNDIDPSVGKEGFAAAQNSDDRAASLANWIELSRGVIELGPGEEKRIPFVIRINLNAIPDTYHAYILFYEGSTREAAEKTKERASITVNVEVQKDVKEILQLNKFFTDSIFFSGDDVLFNYQFENIGNQDLTPKGEIRVYDRKGKEVASIAVNGEAKHLSPSEMTQLASVWTAASGFGKYKAFLNVDYGSSQKASVQDTVYFWIVPWQQLLGSTLTTIIAMLFLALYIHKRYDARHRALHAALVAHTGETVRAAIPTPSVVEAPPKARRSISSLWRRQKTISRVEEQNVVPPQPESPPLPVRPSAPAHTVDLTNLQQPKPVKRENHVINLKGH